VAQEGTGRLLDATKDLLGGLAAVASRGVSWAADKISKTEAYKEWEKKPIGPRAKAVHEIAGSAFGGMITVSYGIRCGIPLEDLPRRDFCRAFDCFRSGFSLTGFSLTLPPSLPPSLFLYVLSLSLSLLLLTTRH
jgi:hypothetical protein